MEIRYQRADEHVTAVIRAAFGREQVVLLAEDLAGGDAHLLSLVATTHDGTVIGQVQLSRGWVDADAQLVAVAVLSPLSVLPAHQGRGVGGSLVRAALARAAELDWPLMFLEGSPDYYARLGFVPAYERGFRAPSPRIPKPAFHVAVLPAYEEWMAGRLVYPDAFWRHDCVGLR